MAEFHGQEGRREARRGRKGTRPDPAAGPVASLACRLWDLKREAGDPSFAQMSSRMGAAASKSSLAAAAQGQLLPSWETTWEFVRVLAVDRLGRDPAETEREWRARWEEASGAGVATTPGERGVSMEHGRRVGGGWPIVVVVATALLAGGVGAFVVLAASDETGENPVTASVAPRDESLFEADVTHPDGTVVERGESFTKVWRIRNAGAVPWRNRYLTRINDTPCRAPERVAISPTAPGQAVDIEVRVRAAERPARCKIFWKMTNADGLQLFAGKNPIFLDVRVR